MDLLGKALEDYYSNEMKSKFIYYRNCLQKKYNGLKLEFDLGIYFRNKEELFPLEKKLLDLSYGNILDIGSSTGYYIQHLMKKGNTTGIEVSSVVNNLARRNGFFNCITGDFFKVKFDKKFDTITLIGNDIAITGTLYRLKRIFKKFKKLLNENGQVLVIINHIRTLKYWHVVFTPHYNGKFGIPAKYLFVNTVFFKKIALKYGFSAEVIGNDESTGILYYLVRLVKLTH